MHPGFTPRIDGFRGDPIGAIHAAKNPYGAPAIHAGPFVWTEAQERQNRLAHEAAAERKRCDEQRVRDRDEFLQLAAGVKDSSDRLRFVIHELTTRGIPGTPVRVAEGTWLKYALPEYFLLTVHCFSPTNPNHAPWDSEQIASEFARRMRSEGSDHEDSIGVPVDRRARVGRAIGTDESTPCWRFEAGCTVDGRAALIAVDGNLFDAVDRRQVAAPRLNVHAIHRITDALGVPLSDHDGEV